MPKQLLTKKRKNSNLLKYKTAWHKNFKFTKQRQIFKKKEKPMRRNVNFVTTQKAQ